MTHERETGTITRLHDKGFGFIRSGARDLFFHLRDLCPPLAFDETLRERRVSFEARFEPKGWRAYNIEAAE